MSILRECAGGGVNGSGISSVYATSCITGNGTAGSPLSIDLQEGGYIYCGANGLYVSGVPTTTVSGESCIVAYSYETGSSPVNPSGPNDPSPTASIQIEVYDNRINFWANPSGVWILDKSFSGGGSGSTVNLNDVKTWLVPNAGSTPQHTPNGNAYRTGKIAIGTAYQLTTSMGGGNSAYISTGNDNKKTKIAVFDNGPAGSAGIGNNIGVLGVHTETSAWQFSVFDDEAWTNRYFSIDMTAGLVTFDSYPKTRDDSTSQPFDNFLYTNASGDILSAPHYFVGEVNNGNSGISKLISFAKRANQKITLTGNCTLTFTPPPSAREVKLRFVQDATGGRTVTFPAGILGSAPAISTTANSQTVISLYYDGDGNWHY